MPPAAQRNRYFVAPRIDRKCFVRYLCRDMSMDDVHPSTGGMTAEEREYWTQLDRQMAELQACIAEFQTVLRAYLEGEPPASRTQSAGA